MQQDTKIIIGSGISGLIWNFYHPEYLIVSPDVEVGGVYARTHLVWLHRTAETEKLLTDLGFPIIPKRSHMGYFHNEVIYDYQTDWLNKKMIQRKMTPWNEKIDENFIPESTEMSLVKAGEVNYMNTLDVDLVEVVRRLGKRARVVPGYVTKITPTEITIVEKWGGPSLTKTYSSIISTMAAPFFWQAYGEPKDFKSTPITNVIVDSKPEFFDDYYEMVYYHDKPFSRISNLSGTWAFEFTGELTKEQFNEMHPKLNVIDCFVVKHGRIWDHDNLSPQENITFSGRFAQWKHKVVTETVTKQALEFKQTT